MGDSRHETGLAKDGHESIRDSESIRAVAEEVRRGFEQKTITEHDVVKAVEKHRPDLATGDYAGGGGSYMARLVLQYFPGDTCEYATAVLRDRLGFGEIVNGSYGKNDGGEYDPETKRYIKGNEDRGKMFHSFLDVGRTELGDHTIVDITHDQFSAFSPGHVYVGPMVPPWADVGRHHKDPGNS